MDLRTVFILFELEQMSRTEVARVLDLPARHRGFTSTQGARNSRAEARRGRRRSAMTERERYLDVPQGEPRRRVIQSAQLDIPSSGSRAKTMAALGLEGAPSAISPSPRAMGRWVVVGIAGLALLGGWLALSRERRARLPAKPFKRCALLRRSSRPQFPR